MRLREAAPHDVSSIGIIQADCNLTDTISRYFTRDWDKYPTSYRMGSTRFCKRKFVTPGAVIYVMETEPSDYTFEERHKAPEVVAFAVWIRIGNSPTAKEWQSRNTGFWVSLERVLNKVEDKYLRVFPTVEPTYRQDKLDEIVAILGTPFDEEIFAEAWDLDLLFVSPQWQRKGLGKQLVHWGFERATEEKVPVILKSSPLGGAAYRALGFQSLGEVGMKAYFNTLEFGGEEPQMWCWEPEDCKGMWYARGKAAFDKLTQEGDGSAVTAVVNDST